MNDNEAIESFSRMVIEGLEDPCGKYCEDQPENGDIDGLGESGNEEERFEVGDIVRTKADGSVMVVKNVFDHGVDCVDPMTPGEVYSYRNSEIEHDQESNGKAIMPNNGHEDFENLMRAFWRLFKITRNCWASYGSIPSYVRNDLKKMCQNVDKDLGLAGNARNIMAISYSPEKEKYLKNKFKNIINQVRMYVQDGDIDDEYACSEIIVATNALVEMVGNSGLDSDFQVYGKDFGITDRMKEAAKNDNFYNR